MSGRGRGRAHYWCSRAYEALGRADIRAAAKAADNARAANPKDPRVMLLTGHLLVMCHRWDDGEEALHAAAAAFRRHGLPVPGQLYNSLATSAMKQFRHQDALAWFADAATAGPNDPEPWVGIGTTLYDMGDDDTAREAFAHATKRWPASIAVRWGRSMWRLRQGEWPEAWDDYELRMAAPDWLMMWGRDNHNQRPLWYGEAKPGCTLMLYHEQGQGDTVMLTRYIPWARTASQCARLYLLVPNGMIRLLAGHGEWIGDRDPPTQPDFATPFSSLPFAHRTRLDTVPPPLRVVP